MGDDDRAISIGCIYEWITEDLLKKILSAYENGDSIVLHRHRVKQANKKGENFTSAIFRAHLDYSTGTDKQATTRSATFILKASLDDAIINEIINEFNVFQRETNCYRDIMHHCRKLLEDIGDQTIFAPRLVYADERIIVQEDLTQAGFRLTDVRKRLDVEHCNKVLSKLAKFHAATVVLHEKKPDVFRYNKPGNLTDKHSPLHDLYRNTMASAIRYMKTVPELIEYVAPMELYHMHVVEKMIGVFTRQNDSFHCLNHGDLWINNIMFKYTDDGRIEDLKLIDYQEGYYGSPGIDLNYFLFTSANEDVLVNHFDEVIASYQQTLADTLGKLDFPVDRIPTLDQIHKEIALKIDHGFVATVCLSPIFILDDPEHADAVNFIVDTADCRAIRDLVFSNSKYGDILKRALPEFRRRGTF